MEVAKDARCRASKPEQSVALQVRVPCKVVMCLHSLCRRDGASAYGCVHADALRVYWSMPSSHVLAMAMYMQLVAISV
jgi:hypothetical protein